jgi:hypothetical protein
MGLAMCAGCRQPPADQPFKAAATVRELMDGPIARATRTYWGSVSTIIDNAGVTEKFPMTDEEWEDVWSSAITIAESGNLLMMPPRARADGDWMKLSTALVDAGVSARKAAESRNPDKVLEAGEQVYNVCTQCHVQYMVDVP